nr:reverse transcriptase domain-containing protein [Tanacetum cinerariifolium]
MTRNCRNKGPATGSNLLPVIVTCHACGEKGHYANQCRKTTNHNAQGRAYMLRDMNAHQDPNVVTEIKDNKGAENIAAEHLSRIENDETSDDSDVVDNFPGEILMEITTNDTPRFADFENYLVGDVIPKGMTYQQKKKIFSDLKNYFWEDPYFFKSFDFDHLDDSSFPRPPPDPPNVEFLFDLEPNSEEVILAVMNNIDELNEDGCFDPGGNRGKGTRKPNLGGRRAGRLQTRQGTQNFRELPLHYPSWRQMPPKPKAGVMAKIRTQFDLRPHMECNRWPQINVGIQQYLQKIYNGKKAALKERYWVPEEDGSYDLERIRHERP